MTTTSRSLRLWVLLALPALMTGQQSKQKESKELSYAILAGTVFRDPGYAQGGATVVLTAKSAPQKKLQEQVSDARGEFAFRVPPGPQTYIIRATLKGFKPAGQEIEISGLEQINATLLLVAESKK